MKKGLFVITIGLVLTLFISVGHAHEKRFVAQRFEFVVGFINEPAFSEQINGVDLRVQSLGRPLEGLEKTLKVTVIRPEEKRGKEIAFRSNYKEVGRYSAYFVPTQPGKYIFHIQGLINDVEINEKFESGSNFHDVEDATALRFP